MTEPDRPETPVVRVLVADEHQLIREGIVSVLAAQPGIVVVGTAATGPEAIERARLLSPNVVLMDVRMPVMSGIEAMMVIRGALPDCQVLVLSAHDDEREVVRALRAGACGYLLKGVAALSLTRAIHLAHVGISPLDRALAWRVIGARDRSPVASPPDELLTSRELEVLGLIAEGSSNREIAARLSLSEGTIKNHVSSILGRLGLRDRTQAAVYAHDHNVAAPMTSDT